MNINTLKNEDIRKKVTVSSFVMSVLVILIHAYYILDKCMSLNLVTAKIAESLCWIGQQYAVRFFFILSGYLMLKGMTASAIKRKLKSRFYSLVIPYILWNLIYFIFYIIASQLGQSDMQISSSFSELVRDIIWHKYYEAYWYVAYLIVYTLSAPIIYVVSRRKSLLIAADIFLVLWQTAVQAGWMKNVLIFGEGWFLFYVLGATIAVLCPEIIHVTLVFQRKMSFVFLAAGMFFCAALTKIAEMVWILWFIMIWITMAYFWFVLLSFIDWNTFLVKRLLKKSFLIYSWHGMVCSFISKAALKILPNTCLSECIAYLAYIFLGLAFIHIFDEAVLKKVPGFRSILLGGRG